MTLDHGKYGLFLTMGNAGFISSTVSGPSHEVPGRGSTQGWRPSETSSCSGRRRRSSGLKRPTSSTIGLGHRVFKGLIIHAHSVSGVYRVFFGRKMWEKGEFWGAGLRGCRVQGLRLLGCLSRVIRFWAWAQTQRLGNVDANLGCRAYGRQL